MLTAGRASLARPSSVRNTLTPSLSRAMNLRVSTLPLKALVQKLTSSSFFQSSDSSDALDDALPVGDLRVGHAPGADQAAPGGDDRVVALLAPRRNVGQHAREPAAARSTAMIRTWPLRSSDAPKATEIGHDVDVAAEHGSGRGAARSEDHVLHLLEVDARGLERGGHALVIGIAEARRDAERHRGRIALHELDELLAAPDGRHRLDRDRDVLVEEHHHRRQLGVARPESRDVVGEDALAAEREVVAVAGRAG